MFRQGKGKIWWDERDAHKTEQQDFRLVFFFLMNEQLWISQRICCQLFCLFVAASFSSRNIDKVYWTFAKQYFLLDQTAIESNFVEL